MFVAGIDAHTTYSVIVVVSNAGELVCKPTRIPNSEPDRLVKLSKGPGYVIRGRAGWALLRGNGSSDLRRRLRRSFLVDQKGPPVTSSQTPDRPY